MYYREAGVIIIVFDVTDRKTFDDWDNWIRNVRHQGASNALIILVANKVDLKREREVTSSEARRFCEANRVTYSEISANTGQGIEELFGSIAEDLKGRTTNGF